MIVRLLLTPRWLGLIALTIAAALVMVLLGRWQWDRYELRHEINSRIDSAGSPVPFTPGLGEWARVTVTGQYDPQLEILVRNRTVNGKVGFEVITPLVFADGTAVLVDRGWVAPHRSGISAMPEVPPAPTGSVTITGRVRATERDGRVELRNGHWEARRIGVPELAAKLPYKVAPIYVTAEETALVPVPVSRENDWLNLGYAVQWWIFAGASFFALYWLARREQRANTTSSGPDLAGPYGPDQAGSYQPDQAGSPGPGLAVSPGRHSAGSAGSGLGGERDVAQEQRFG